MSDIARNLAEVSSRIGRAAVASGRDPSTITLVAVCKTLPVTLISEAIQAGISHLGENRVQEAEPKIRFFASSPAIEWHLVGHLQSNKARRAAELFQCVHSVDSVKLAQKLSQAAGEIGKPLSVLIQIDLGGEPTKFGAGRERVRELVAAVADLPGLKLDGLMSLPPFFEDPQRSRPFFAELREIAAGLESEQPGCLGRRHLSMGMSHDFEVAIEEGATLVRIGTAIFGTRTPAAR